MGGTEDILTGTRGCCLKLRVSSFLLCLVGSRGGATYHVSIPLHDRYFLSLEYCIGPFPLIGPFSFSFLTFFCSSLPFVHGWHSFNAFSIEFSNYKKEICL